MKLKRPARALAALALAAGSFSPALAGTQRLPTPVPATQVPVEQVETPRVLHPALWVAKDADTTIYLFGTMHVLKPGLDWFNGPVERALDSSDELVTEIVDPTGTATQAAVLARATLPRGETLRAMMGGEDRAAYEALMAKIHLPPAALDQYKPWYVAVVLSSLPLVQQGLDPKNGAEARLDSEMKDQGKPHDALETVDGQLGMFDSLPRAAQLAYLAEVVKDYDKVVPQIDELLKAWGQGDAAELAKNMNDEMDDPRLMKTLLTDRNANWAKWIAHRMGQPGTVFVAVGAGHLAGKGSVQDQLKALGIATARVQ
ncbi:MAG: TraB/GumN family protein [Sphingomonadales bacterium]|nr:TraB/GumN family protein [Sphingomonadales bacterium]MDE2570104.1 TraB/GumN family protein [Sphingomonadales bacterium]